MNKSILDILCGATAVTIVANTKVEGNPLVTPITDKSGNPKVDLEGRELGSIRLEQKCRTVSGTFLNSRNRVAFIGGTMDELGAIVKENNLKSGSELPGKLIVIESLAPMYKNHEPKMNPSTAEVVNITVGDKQFPVYAQTRYTTNDADRDVLIRDANDVTRWLAAQSVMNAAPVVTEDAAIPQA